MLIVFAKKLLFETEFGKFDTILSIEQSRVGQEVVSSHTRDHNSPLFTTVSQVQLVRPGPLQHNTMAVSPFNSIPSTCTSDYQTNSSAVQ